MSLTWRILLGIILGFVTGLILHPFAQNQWINDLITDGLLDIIASIFITLMKMLVVPLVFTSIVCGSSNIGDTRSIGRIGLKTIVLYLFTTAIAISLALLISTSLNIGTGANFVIDKSMLNVPPPPALKETLLGLFTSNPISSLAEGHMLQIIVFALMFGVAINFAGSSGTRIKSWFEDINSVIMALVSMVIALAPYGVFALIARLVIETELYKLLYLFGYFFTVVFALFFHLFFTNGLILLFLARLNPWPFFKKMLPVQLFAFSTSSSNATLPITLTTVEEKLGVSNKVAGFTIPLGATINMDGTAIMQGVATVFIAHVYNIDLSLVAYMTIILTATLSSIGTAGVPGVGLITLTMVLTQVGLPVEGVALIIGIDRILDMLRTAVNVSGDAAVTTYIAKSEKLIDKNIYVK
ncbi:MAG: dicarboxylate/amino acid:cation symporter [Francisellaceae bacterium]